MKITGAELTPQRLMAGGEKRGFTLFELIVVIALISVVILVGLGYYRRLLVEIEQATLEYNIGTMRSSLATRYAEAFVAGKSAEMQEWVGRNPVELLKEPPKNYLGVIDSADSQELKEGHWYFDQGRGLLIYLVRNSEYFSSPLAGRPRIRFEISPVFAEKRREENNGHLLSGLVIRPVEDYHWLKTTQ